MTDSIGPTIPKILAILRDAAVWEDDSDYTLASGLADRLERLDAEMRKELDEERETHAQLQARCFDQGSQSVFDCVKELRARLAACENGEVSYAIYQDDEWQAEADSLPDALHYAMMYGQDGPVRMEKIIRIPMDTPTAHPDVPVNLCTICGELVPVAESEKHCAGHAR